MSLPPSTDDPPRLIAGAMSGTSADGVDVAIVRVAGRGEAMKAQLLAHRHRDYAADLRRLIFSLRADKNVSVADVCRCTREISLAYAETFNEAISVSGISTADIAAVAAHGQTLYHAPPDTLQLLDPSLLAAKTGCTVVSDFRRADCAAGGQGAPLVPFADHVLFRHPTKTRVLLNIGGIANLTHLRAGGTLNDLVAFDTGPGNCVSDHLMRLAHPDGRGVDDRGEIAARGVPVFPVLQRVLEANYFSRPLPKSTDGPAMIEIFLAAQRSVGRNFPFENLLKTACLFTATTITDAMRNLDPLPDELIVSGGGVHNATIMSLLRQPLADLPIRTTDELGVPADAKEAIAFALLGAATLDGLPSNVPAATGATRPVVLGSVAPAP